MITKVPLNIFLTAIAVPLNKFFRSILMILVICSSWSVSVVQAQPFPAAGDDGFWSMGKFRINTTNGVSTLVDLEGPTCVLRSDSHDQGTDPSGDLGGGVEFISEYCYFPSYLHLPDSAATSSATSDLEIGSFPLDFNSGDGQDEVHTEIVGMRLAGGGFTIQAGPQLVPAINCLQQPNLKRSLGEVEARDGQSGFGGSGADSFFNLFLAISTPIGNLYNPSPLTVRANEIHEFPPYKASYMHGFNLSGRVRLYDCNTGCFAATLAQGSHYVGGGGTGSVFPPLARPRILLPIIFSVDKNAEGLYPYPNCPHPVPQDVYNLGSQTENTGGKLFQSSGRFLGEMPDVTNATLNNLSSALGIASDDNIISLSFGQDGGGILLFSVDPSAKGAADTSVEFNSTFSPLSSPFTTNPPSNSGGSPSGGLEAAGDIYVSYIFPKFGHSDPPSVIDCLRTVVAAPAVGTNVMGVDEASLGLQAPADNYSIKGPPEDDLDALEASDGSFVDFVFFTLSENSPSLGTAFTANDILVAKTSAKPSKFTIYAHGIDDIGLLEGDKIDALALWDGTPRGRTLNEDELNDGEKELDEALFSLAKDSPSLSVGANPHMPGAGPFSPGDVFRINFRSKKKIRLYASASELGLQEDDELNALDIGPSPPRSCIVTLAKFDDDSVMASTNNGVVTLTWKTMSEINNAGFFVWRGQLKADKAKCSLNTDDYTEVKQLNSILVPAKGDGSSYSGFSYSYEDNDVISGNTYCYALEDIELDGKRYDDRSHLSDPISASMP